MAFMIVEVGQKWWEIQIKGGDWLGHKIGNADKDGKSLGNLNGAILLVVGGVGGA